MRWFWIDRFVEFESGVRAVASKNVSFAEDYLHDHFPGYPVFPPTLMVEGMAQTAGILVGEARRFREKVILAKIRRARFDEYCTPGDEVRYEAIVESIEDAGATTRGVATRNGVRIAVIDLMFSHVDRASGEIAGLPEHNFVFTEEFLSLLRSFLMGEKGRT